MARLVLVLLICGIATALAVSGGVVLDRPAISVSLPAGSAGHEVSVACARRCTAGAVSTEH